MSQHRRSLSLPPPFSRPTVLVETQEEAEAWSKAMEDIGLHHTQPEWERLNWWVKFCQRDVPSLPLEDKYRLQKELAVLEKLGTRYEMPVWFEPPPLLPFPQIEELRLQVLKIFGHLADTRSTRIRSCQVFWEVHQPQSFDHRGRIGRANRVVLTRLTSEGLVQRREDIFLIQLQELLRAVPQGICRCPHCKRLFLQVKRQARYCGRRCQSVATMRRSRAQANA